MDPLPPSCRDMFRIGVVISAVAATAFCMAVSGIRDAGAAGIIAVLFVVVGILGAIGAGLMFGARFARVLGGLLFLVGLVGSPIHLIRGLAASGMPESADPSWFLWVANAIATTLLLMWLCLQALRVLSRKVSRRGGVVTARITGGVLAVVAANHLWVATQVGMDSHGAWSITISPHGSQLFGFPGWPFWHLALLVVALVLLCAPRTLLHHAATALMLLFGSLLPLVALAVALTGLFMLEMLLVLIVISLVPAYLSWWLRDELRQSVRP